MSLRGINPDPNRNISGVGCTLIDSGCLVNYQVSRTKNVG